MTPFSDITGGLLPPDRSLGAIWRNSVRPKLFPNSILSHNDELSSVTRFPLGRSWQRYAGMKWCPYCLSVAPLDFLRLIRDVKLWDIESSSQEFSELVARGEMEPSSPRAMRPSPGSGYVHYAFSTRAPIDIILVLTNRSVLLTVSHFVNCSDDVRAMILTHLNRLSSMITWGIDRDGDLMWSFSGFRPGDIFEIDEDDDLEETLDDPEDPDQQD